MTQNFVRSFQNEIRKVVAKPHRPNIGWSDVVTTSGEVVMDVIIVDCEGREKV